MNRSFPYRLRTARLMMKLSQRDLADRSGLVVSAISQFETDARKPSFDNLKRIADALEVTTDYLLGRIDDRHGIVGSDRIHRDLKKLSEPDRVIAENLIRDLARRSSKELFSE